MKTYTGEDINELKKALEIVIHSEWIGVDCESANWHHLQDNLQEILDHVHTCKFDGERHVYKTGDGTDFEGEIYATETECSVDPSCHFTEYVEID